LPAAVNARQHHVNCLHNQLVFNLITHVCEFHALCFRNAHLRKEIRVPKSEQNGVAGKMQAASVGTQRWFRLWREASASTTVPAKQAQNWLVPEKPGQWSQIVLSILARELCRFPQGGLPGHG
jgi:hypothetical protein